MYTLYFLPGACSLATQVVLRELGQEVTLIDKQTVDNYTEINPVGTVPVLVNGDQTLTEGAAVMIHLLSNHPNKMWPGNDPVAKQSAIQDIMFANATMHPAYSRLFFAANSIENVELRSQVFEAAASNIRTLWQVVEDKLTNYPFLGGEHVSAADIMLAVYSRWGEGFPVDINIPPKAQKMIEHVVSMPSFAASLAAEQDETALANAV